ncbi:MAG TPA: hypothetical protein VLM79_03040 [Kofleriaceae bacterium]|nr:hypothetical protein [Kofleriaceae bacterium]
MFWFIHHFDAHTTVIPALPQVRYRRLSSCIAAALAFLPLIG